MNGEGLKGPGGSGDKDDDRNGSGTAHLFIPVSSGAKQKRTLVSGD